MSVLSSVPAFSFVMLEIVCGFIGGEIASQYSNFALDPYAGSVLRYVLSNTSFMSAGGAGFEAIAPASKNELLFAVSS